MSLTHILLLVVLALFVVMIRFVIQGIREKNWKKVIISITVFLAIIMVMYFGLIRLITSM